MVLRFWLEGLVRRQSHRGNGRARRWESVRTTGESLEVRIVPARVNPYLQNPATDGMTVMWFTQDNVAGTLTVNLPGGGTQVYTSTPVLASALAYHANEAGNPGLPYQHRVRVTGLQAGTSYNYSVVQGSETFNNTFKTIPDQNTPIRFTVYADSETEPESTGSKVQWDQYGNNLTRPYLVDQTEGYKQNLNIIESRNPDFMGIAGDLVESGGEQRDWEEFWKHNSGSFNDVAGKFPLLTSPGNHEDYGGPGGFGGYGDAGSIRGRDKYKTYFEYPDNGSGVSTYEDRYYRVDYGPITYISLDVTNGANNGTSTDTNWLLGSGPGYPDFNPGSVQYAWLEAQLEDAQSKSQFIFVQFHHVPYSVGPHGFPTGSTGNANGTDNQSGVPVRVLTPLFLEYGVDAVFAGHDEQYQHSNVDGIHFYDVGMGGDGLRGPSSGEDGSTGLPSSNPYQVFTAHLNAPEVWNGLQLVSGGKHYGHMEVNVFVGEDGHWKATLEPAYAFPLMNASGTITGWERRVYNDVVTLTGAEANIAPVLDADGAPTLDSILGNVANGNNPGTLVSDLIARMGPNGGITDANTSPSFGIAINGVQSTNGTWQYSINGGTNWSNVGAASNDAARLLASDANTRVRFVPNAGFLGEAKISFVAWDQTEGTNGGTGITKGRGGMSTFSAAFEYASIFVTNAAPVLDADGVPTLDQITLNVPNGSNPGTLVTDIIARMSPDGGISDANPNALTGIAINGLSHTANGTWEFTVNSGTNWTPIGTTGNTNARLLYADGNTRIRFVPNAGFLGEPKLAFVAWDRTTGSNGGVANVNNRGGTTPYSLVYEYATIKVVNTAPVLTASNSSFLDGILVNTPNGNNPGTLVSDLIARMGPSGGISDPNPGALQGIAVVAMSGTATGTWQFTTNGGTTWSALGATGTINARLLAADGNTRVRYVPNAGFTGSVKIAFTAWDRTSGVNGTLVNAGNRGGITPYSLAYDYASIEVVSNAEVILESGASAFEENGGSTTITARLTAPVDHDVYVTLGLDGTAVNDVGYRVTTNTAPIVLDGSFDDWENNSNVVWGTDAFNDTHDTNTNGELNTPSYVNHPDADLRKFGVTHDDQNLYFYFESTGIIGRTRNSAAGSPGRYYVIVTMDVDENDVTGYPLHEGGYYPTTGGYDMNSEIEFYDGAFNTGHYLNHGAMNQAEKDQAFEDQSQGGYNPALASQATQGPFDPGFVNVLPGTYDYYTQWVYKENDPANEGNDSITFVKDRGPVVLGIIECRVSADGHKLEMIVPYKGFLKDQLGNAIVEVGKTLDLSFSLEASGELAPGNQWASDTADPLNGYHLTPSDQTGVNVIRIPAGQTSASVTISGIDDSDVNPGRTAVVSIASVAGATERGVQELTLSVEDDELIMT